MAMERSLEHPRNDFINVPRSPAECAIQTGQGAPLGSSWLLSKQHSSSARRKRMPSPHFHEAQYLCSVG
jgi:hypothetical protein